ILKAFPNGSLQLIASINGAAPVSDLALADMNGDGALDVVTVSTGALGLAGTRIYLNDGSGGLLPPILINALGSFPQSIAVGDFDGDGDADLAVANLLSNDVDVHPSVAGPNGDVVLPVASALPTTTGAQSVIAFDADGDGDRELAVMVI